MKTINVGLIGHKFMGRAHTHAYTDVSVFFDPEIHVSKRVICADEESVHDIAKRWGWERSTLDWREVVNDVEIDLVDISAPSTIHAQVAIAAARAGKHILCEKPLSLNIDDAEEMVRTAKEAGVINMIGFNYRRVPALALARQLIQEGRIGVVHHFRGIYQQSWLINPQFPLVWRLQKKDAGYGSHGDLGAHVIDLARYLVGDIDRVFCEQQTFTTKRPKPASVDGLVAVAGDEIGSVDVDDASAILLRFAGIKAMGYIEVTRYGTGHRNQNRIEVNGSKGAILFDMEKMNELHYYSTADESHVQGFRRIQVGEGSHPYMANWWPAGHIIGYGDTFVNQAFDLISAIRDDKPVKPDFLDGLICQKVLDAAARSVSSGSWESVS